MRTTRVTWPSKTTRDGQPAPVSSRVGPLSQAACSFVTSVVSSFRVGAAPLTKNYGVLFLPRGRRSSTSNTYPPPSPAPSRPPPQKSWHLLASGTKKCKSPSPDEQKILPGVRTRGLTILESYRTWFFIPTLLFSFMFSLLLGGWEENGAYLR